jgi:hypothetical protein
MKVNNLWENTNLWTFSNKSADLFWIIFVIGTGSIMCIFGFIISINCDSVPRQNFVLKLVCVLRITLIILIGVKFTTDPNWINYVSSFVLFSSFESIVIARSVQILVSQYSPHCEFPSSISSEWNSQLTRIESFLLQIWPQDQWKSNEMINSSMYLHFYVWNSLQSRLNRETPLLLFRKHRWDILLIRDEFAIIKHWNSLCIEIVGPSKQGNALNSK